jgi:hypothetical protein
VGRGRWLSGKTALPEAPEHFPDVAWIRPWLKAGRRVCPSGSAALRGGGIVRADVGIHLSDDGAAPGASTHRLSAFRTARRLGAPEAVGPRAGARRQFRWVEAELSWLAEPVREALELTGPIWRTQARTCHGTMPRWVLINSLGPSTPASDAFGLALVPLPAADLLYCPL